MYHIIYFFYEDKTRALYSITISSNSFRNPYDFLYKGIDATTTFDFRMWYGATRMDAPNRSKKSFLITYVPGLVPHSWPGVHDQAATC